MCLVRTSFEHGEVGRNRCEQLDGREGGPQAEPWYQRASNMPLGGLGIVGLVGAAVPSVLLWMLFSGNIEP